MTIKINSAIALRAKQTWFLLRTLAATGLLLIEQKRHRI